MNKPIPQETYYIISYKDPMDGKAQSLRARNIRDSNLGLGFVAISDFLFEHSSKLLVDPSAEKLKNRFENTKSLHLSLYSIISIEEVGLDNKGLVFEKDKSNLFMFPSPHSDK